MSDVRAGFAHTDDGQSLYWRTLGSGPRTLVCCNGVGVSTFFWKYIAEHYRKTCTVVLWDYRGHGRSSAPRDLDGLDLSMERNAADATTVLDHLGITGPVVLLGHSMGCQVALEFHKQHPERVEALILMFGTYGKALDTFMDLGNARQVFEIIKRTTRGASRGSLRLLMPLYASPVAYAFSKATGLVDRYYAGKADMDRYLDHLVQMDPRVFVGMVEQMADHDLEEHLPDIAVPALVFGGENDLFTPLHRSQTMVDLIPDAELTIVAEGSHAAIVEHPEAINARIDRFLSERLPVPEAPAS